MLSVNIYDSGFIYFYRIYEQRAYMLENVKFI